MKHLFSRMARFEKLVTQAYLEPGGPDHRRIKEHFDRWIGLKPSLFSQRHHKRFLHQVAKASRRIATGGGARDLGPAPLGVDDLSVHCWSSDTNTALVYLFGASDNLPIFRIYQDRVRPGMTVLDVGANVGMHTVVLANICGPRGRVHAYEPLDELVDRLRENLRANQLGNVTTHDKAVGDVPGPAGFEASLDQPNIGKSRLSPSGKASVEVVRLDDQHPEEQIDLLKIDVEGREIEVLRGARRLLERSRPLLVLEFNPDDYDLDSLISSIPYPVQIAHVPNTLSGELRPLAPADPGLRALGESNLVILPAG